MPDAGEILKVKVKDGTGPAPIDFGGSTFVFYRPEGKFGFMYVRRDPDGAGGYGSWSDRQGFRDGVGILDGTEPAAVVLGQRLYVFWHGFARDGFFYTSTQDGKSWAGVESVKARIGGVMGVGGDHSPCLAAHEGRIHLFWRGVQAREGMFHASHDGAMWDYHGSLQDRIANHGAQAKTMPGAAAIAGGPLYLFWNGAGKDGLFYATLGGGAWSGARPMRDHIGSHGIGNGASPSVSGYGAGFYLFWNGAGGDGIYWTRHDGAGFMPGQRHVFALARIPGERPPRAVSAACAPGPQKVELYWRDQGSDRLFFATLGDRADWMARVKDETLSLGALDLPGSHDAAAINRNLTPGDGAGSVNAHPWDCQNLGIREQLDQGVRVLDIRIQLTAHLKSEAGPVDRVEIHTCHGAFGSSLGLNRYQSLESVFQEIAGFLADHRREAVVVILKIDDESYDFLKYYSAKVGYQTRTLTLNGNIPGQRKRLDDLKLQSRRALSKLVERFSGTIHNLKPDRSKGGAGMRTLPMLKEVRGKIVLLNRILSPDNEPDDLALGYALHWSENATGVELRYGAWQRSRGASLGPATPVVMALQDRYEEVERAEKVDLFNRLAPSFPDADVLINYASCTRGYQNLGKPLIQEELLAAGDGGGPTTGPGPARPGWAMFDFVAHYRRSPATGEAMTAIDYVLGFNDLG